MSAVLFFLLTLFYIVLEIYFNFSLVQQLSIGSSERMMDRLELFGKILSGIGIGMLLAKEELDECGSSLFDFLKTFVVSCFIGIICSFALQTIVIKTVVAIGSDEDKAKALLTTQLTNTVIPFFKNSAYGGESTLTEDQYFQASKTCRDKTGMPRIESTIDRVAYSYNNLRQPFQEEQYKQTIYKYQDCLVNKILDIQMPNPTFDDKILSEAQIKEEAYKKYQKINNLYKENKKRIDVYKSNSAFDRNARHNLTRSMRKDWIEGMHKAYGPQIYFKPNLTKTEFYNHADYKKLKYRFPSSREILTQHYESRKKIQYQNIMFDTFLVYEMYKPAIKELNIENKQSLEMLNKDNRKMANQAYKSIVLPIIALFFSLVFLLLNVFSLITFLINRVESKFTRNHRITKLSQYISYAVCLWLFSAPLFIQDTRFDGNKSLVSTVLTHEKVLVDMYNNLTEKKAKELAQLMLKR